MYITKFFNTEVNPYGLHARKISAKKLIFCVFSLNRGGRWSDSLDQLRNATTAQYEQLQAQHALLKEALDALLTSLAEAGNSTDENSNTDTTHNSSDTCAYSGGVTYKRWGRTECPENATLVYEGSQKTLQFQLRAYA